MHFFYLNSNVRNMPRKHRFFIPHIYNFVFKKPTKAAFNEYMKQKIFQALKQAYPQLGLSDEILLSHAAMLEAFVTDENLSDVVAKQSPYLSALQSANDKRVSEATAKVKGDSQKALDEAVKNAIEEERKRVSEENNKRALEGKGKEPDFLTAFRKEMEQKDAQTKAERDELTEQIRQLIASGKKQEDSIKALKDENEAMKLEKSRVERESMILETAKSLGIPQWRIDEGFSLDSSLDSEGIKSTLSKVASNIKTAGLQGNGGRFLGDDVVSKEDIDALADSILK